jgi:2-iminoacetate synthase ThiH
VALSFGADDIDGTVMEEKIYHMAGATTPQEMARNELVHAIREAGRDPVQRDSLYREIAVEVAPIAAAGNAVQERLAVANRFALAGAGNEGGAA